MAESEFNSSERAALRRLIEGGSIWTAKTIDEIKQAVEYNAHDLGEFGKMIRIEYVHNILDRYAQSG